MDKQVILTRLVSSAEDIRRRFGVKRLAVFGSISRGETNKWSDVDILVSFEQAATFDLFMDLKFHLEELLGIPVDLVTDDALRPQIRQAIQSELIDVA